MDDSQAALGKLQRLDRGREAFRALISRWMSRSGWSYAVLAELAELAVTEVEAAGMPPFTGGEKAGAVFICNGHVWRALVDLAPKQLAPIYSNSSKSTPDWDKEVFEHVAAIRRLFPSQINNLLRGVTQNVYAVTFDSLGLLNEWLAAVQNGRRPKPVDERLKAAAASAVLVQDKDGLYGAEEFLGLYLGLLDPPEEMAGISDEDAEAMTKEVGRLIRSAMAAADLDLIEDWQEFVAVLPTQETARLRRVRDVALGVVRWTADEVENEAAAVRLAVRQLMAGHGKDVADLQLD